MKPACIASIAFVVSVVGCAKSTQTFAPADKKLARAYAELLVLSEEFKSQTSHLDSTSYQQEVQAVLARNGLTREQFSDRLKALAQSSAIFQQFSDSVRKDVAEHTPK